MKMFCCRHKMIFHMGSLFGNPKREKHFFFQVKIATIKMFLITFHIVQSPKLQKTSADSYCLGLAIFSGKHSSILSTQ